MITTTNRLLHSNSNSNSRLKPVLPLHQIILDIIMHSSNQLLGMVIKGTLRMGTDIMHLFLKVVMVSSHKQGMISSKGTTLHQLMQTRLTQLQKVTLVHMELKGTTLAKHLLFSRNLLKGITLVSSLALTQMQTLQVIHLSLVMECPQHLNLGTVIKHKFTQLGMDNHLNLRNRCIPRPNSHRAHKVGMFNLVLFSQGTLIHSLHQPRLVMHSLTLVHSGLHQLVMVLLQQLLNRVMLLRLMVHLSQGMVSSRLLTVVGTGVVVMHRRRYMVLMEV